MRSIFVISKRALINDYKHQLTTIFKVDIDKGIMPCRRISSMESPTDIFLECVDWIQREVMGHADPVVLIFDIVPDNLNPLLGHDQWNTAAAMLFLTFPDLRWVFKKDSAYSNPDQEQESQDLISQHNWEDKAAYDSGPTLFDSKGLRNWVRAHCTPEKEEDKPFIREKLAAAIDDEEAYGFFHAYIMYRYGYRCYCLTTLKDALAVFGKDNKLFEKPSISLEDVYISYPDKEAYKTQNDFHLSWFRKDPKRPDDNTRHEVLPGLDDCVRRIVISVAHAHDKETWNNMLTALEDWKSKNAGARSFPDPIKKPTSGIFDLWLQLWPQTEPKDLRPRPQGPSSKSDTSSHSAPGRLKLVAEVLLRRASERAKTAQRIPEIVTAAVLAWDAYELARQTPAIAVDALVLAHAMEVKAECEFPGVAWGIEVKPRLKEIEDYAKRISKYVDEDKKKTYMLDVQARVITKIMRIFNDYKQFDEEQTCLSRLRDIHCELEWLKTVCGPWSKRSRSVGKWLLDMKDKIVRWSNKCLREAICWLWKKIGIWIVCLIKGIVGLIVTLIWHIPRILFVGYINILLKSPLLFVGAIVYWLIVLSLGYYWLNIFPVESSKLEVLALENSAYLALQTFIGVTLLTDFHLPHPPAREVMVAMVIAKVLGWFHLAILFSHVYNLVRRR